MTTLLNQLHVILAEDNHLTASCKTEYCTVIVMWRIMYFLIPWMEFSLLFLKLLYLGVNLYSLIWDVKKMLWSFIEYLQWECSRGAQNVFPTSPPPPLANSWIRDQLCDTSFVRRVVRETRWFYGRLLCNITANIQRGIHCVIGVIWIPLVVVSSSTVAIINHKDTNGTFLSDVVVKPITKLSHIKSRGWEAFLSEIEYLTTYCNSE